MHIFDDKDKEGQAPTVDDTEVTDSIEIDVSDAGEGDDKDKGAEGGGEKPKAAKKPDGRLQRRINVFSARAHEAETTAERLRRENEELRAQLTETSKKAESADRAALVNYEESVTAKLAAAKRELVDAQATGDAQKIADATADVGKWSAEAGRLENWKRNQPAADEGDADEGDPEPRPQPRTQTPQQPRLSPEAQQFIADNPWFSPGTKDKPNPDFDMDMHQFARAHGAVLEQRYRRQGKAIDQAYWDQLAADVKAEFGYDDEGDPDPAPTPRRGVPKMGGDAAITPARGTNGAPASNGANGSSTKITLTAEQRQFARNMVDQGVYKDPKTGEALTYEQAERRYARALINDRQQQQMKRGA